MAKGRKGIPYPNIARIDIYCFANVHSKWRILRKWWQSLIYLFIGRWRRKVEDAFEHVYAYFFIYILEQRNKYKLKLNLLNINMKTDIISLVCPCADVFYSRIRLYSSGWDHMTYDVIHVFYTRIIKVDFICFILIAHSYIFSIF